jgi:hypothetical protein
MKKLILSITTLCLTISLTSQDLAKNIPQDADVVISLKGKNITDLMSISQFSNTEMGKMIGKEMSKDTDGKLNKIEDFGLNFNSNFYFFLETEEGVFNSVFMIPVHNTNGFLDILSEREKERIVKEGNISYFQDDYDGITTLWNNNTIMVIIPKSVEDEYADNPYGYTTTLC